MNLTKHVYAICYIERKTYHLLGHQLKTRGYKHLKAFIPVIKLVEKTRKGKIVYKEVPLLFNYGFIRMPREMAYDRHAIIKLKKSIPSIRTFLKSNENLFPKKKKKRIDNHDDWDDFSQVAICPIKDIKRFRRLSKNNKAFSLENMFSIKKGDFLILHKYPYIGIEAEIEEVNYVKRTVRLNMYPQLGKMTLDMPLEEVLYSVYKNWDPEKPQSKHLNWKPKHDLSKEDSYDD